MSLLISELNAKVKELADEIMKDHPGIMVDYQVYDSDERFKNENK